MIGWCVNWSTNFAHSLSVQGFYQLKNSQRSQPQYVFRGLPPFVWWFLQTAELSFSLALIECWSHHEVYRRKLKKQWRTISCKERLTLRLQGLFLNLKFVLNFSNFNCSCCQISMTIKFLCLLFVSSSKSKHYANKFLCLLFVSGTVPSIRVAEFSMEKSSPKSPT